MKKLLSIALVVVLLAGIAVSGTMAYLTSEDSDVNVMTLGNVEIEQHEYERVEKDDGTYEMVNSTKYGEGYKLQEFTQDKPLYPATGAITGWGTKVPFDQIEGASGAQAVFAGLNNVQDKFVLVENTGKSDAYVRTFIALEYGSNEKDIIGISTGDFWTWNDLGVMEIGGNNYYVFEAVYKGSDSRHIGGVLPADEYTYNSLGQVYLSSKATNEDVEALDGNKNDTYDILVLSQAVQTEGFADAATALETAFPKGENNANVPGWFKNLEWPRLPGEPAPANDKAEYNGTEYADIYAAVAAANANGGGTITLLGSAKLDKPVVISSDITIVGDNAHYTRADGFTGTMFTVKPGATLTAENVVLDGAGADAIGNLINTEGNGSIVLNAGTVLKNNKGAHAVNLATRGGGTLTLNGAEISNNESDSGAIWGGGHIIINEGSKINNNSSTGSAGAIRMVSACNLTMNGGEISNNKAAGDGGAIWGYGSSTYNFNGGEMSGNESAGTGGAIYTGDSSVINISGTFEMCDNKAAADLGGALRLTNRATINMTGGKISGNSPKMYGWNPGVNLTGGEFADDFLIQGGLTPTIGAADITGVIIFDLSTNHNTANLAANFKGFKFSVTVDDNFAAFNFKPAAGYTYTAGDEDKLVCMNEGYETYWDAATGTFRLQAK